MTVPDTHQDRARELVDDLVANGADLRFHPAIDCRPPGFHYELRAGGDRQRCRRLIASAKADALVWAAVVAEIAARCQGGAHAA